MSFNSSWTSKPVLNGNGKADHMSWTLLKWMICCYSSRIELPPWTCKVPRKRSPMTRKHTKAKNLYLHWLPILILHMLVVCCALAKGMHPLYLCDAFKSMSQDEKRSTLRTHNMCFNRLRTGHSAPRCNSSHRCKKCQRLHHTLLHLEYRARDNSAQNADSSSTPSGANPTVNAHVRTAHHLHDWTTRSLIYCQSTDRHWCWTIFYHREIGQHPPTPENSSQCASMRHKRTSN